MKKFVIKRKTRIQHDRPEFEYNGMFESGAGNGRPVSGPNESVVYGMFLAAAGIVLAVAIGMIFAFLSKA